MKTPRLALAMGYIADDLVSKAIEYNPAHKKVISPFHNWIKWIAVAACLCIVVIGSMTIVNYTSTSRGSMEIEKIEISAVKESGTAFTKNEIQNFLMTSGNYVISRIAEKMDITAERIVISENGYYHVTVTENGNILNLDYLTLPVIADGKIITSVTLYRDAGEVKYEFHYGSSWGDKITELLIQYPNEQFVMIYVGDFVEAALSTNNTVHFLNGEIDGVFENGVDYYNAFKFDENTMDSSLLE